MTEHILQTHGLCKRFGAVIATENLELGVRRGEIHALIGPNGAGKTSIINQIAGEIAPDAGAVVFDGRDITRLPVHRRAELGLARSFQVSSLFDGLSVIQNVSLAIQPTLGHSFRFWRDAGSDPALRAPAYELLARVALEHCADVPAGALSHGDKRRLELAMALARDPKMLLLDEPMAGTDPQSSRQMSQFLETMRGDVTLLLVEHDMDAVFAIANTVSVLVRGTLIASGGVDEIREDREVQRAYLGDTP